MTEPSPTEPPTLRDLSLTAAARAVDAGRLAVCTDARELIVDAVLAVVARRDRATLDRILADAEHHEACARLSKTPEGGISHSSIAAGLRIAEGYVRANQPKETPDA